jgi:polysaccharide pyruvyl transferase WcaK-like protein
MAPVKILLVNSDLAVNRGDRAIAEGIIALVAKHLPDAQLTAISQNAARDAEWLGVDVLAQGVHSLKPGHFLTFLRQARRSDVVLWGGGELLKDYTNRLGLWYWALKMVSASIVAPSVIGVYQGIGPTSGKSSKWIIARVVSRTHRFLVRDHESREKLLAWGVDPVKVVATFDSAIASVPEQSVLPAELLAANGLDEAFLEDFVAIAPRDWFHYRQGGIIPHRWRKKPPSDPRHDTYLANVVAMLDHLATTYGRVVLVPMHVEEDVALCERLVSRMADPDRARVLANDVLSPRQLRQLVGRARLMVALRLHAGIVATSMGVPTVTYYYVDKGRLYADQVGLSEFAGPIEDLVADDAVEQFSKRVTSLLGSDTALATMNSRLDTMRADVDQAFADAVAPRD